MPTQQFNNYANLITFTRASTGTALRPISYGAERLTNGNFAAGTANWAALNGTISAASGVLTVTATGLNYGQANQNIATVVGATYKVTATVSRGTADTGWVLFNGNIVLNTVTTTPTELTGSFVATSTTTLITIQTNNLVSNATILCGGISVKQVIFDQAGDPLTLFNHPNNVPRIEYDADGNRLGLLIEEARTNLAPNSVARLATGWVNNGSTSTNLPENALGVFPGVLVASAGQVWNRLFQSTTFPSVTSGLVYTIQLWVKSGTSGRIYVGIENATTFAETSFSGAFGSIALVGTAAGTGSFIKEETLSGGIKVITLQFTPNFTGPLRVGVGPNTATVGQDITFYGAQIELGAFPTSYIPTTGAAATRAVDIASISTSAFGYNVTAGTVVCEFDTQYGTTGFPRIWELGSTASGVNRILTFVNAGGSTVNAEVVSNSVTQAGFTLYTDPTPAVGKVALAFTENSFFATSNGSAAQIDSAGTMTPSAPRTLIKLGGDTTGPTSNISGHLKSIQYYPRPLSPAQIQELTR